MSLSTSSDIFSNLIEKLLAGDVICAVVSEHLFKHLEDPSNQQEIDTYLRRIGRVLRSTQDGSGYYVAYRDINNSTVKLQIKRQFSEAINDLEPLVRWLRLALSAERTGTPLRPGGILRGSELLEAIENAPALVDELDLLSRARLFNTTSTGPKKQLDSILKRLCEKGYLIPKGTTGSVFIATGKWARLYEVLQFIADHERLDLDEDVPEQSELLN